MSRRHYIDSARFSESLCNWVIASRAADAAGTERPPIPDPLARDLITLTHRVARKAYAMHPMLDDIEAFALLHALTVLHTYDPDSGSAFAWLTTVVGNACVRFLQMEDAARFRALAYGRYMTDHHGARCGEFLADHQQTIQYHEKRLADLRSTRAEKRAEQPKPTKPRKPGLTPDERNARRREQYAAQAQQPTRTQQRRSVTLPSGEVITAFQLATRLGTTHTMIYRRLRAGKTVADILTEFGGT